MFLVELIGGSNELEGNVFAKNPKTGVYGPVCDDNWTIQNVRIIFNFLIQLILISWTFHSQMYIYLKYYSGCYLSDHR